MWNILKRTFRMWWELTKRILAFPLIILVVFAFLPLHIIFETFEMYHVVFDRDKFEREEQE